MTQANVKVITTDLKGNATESFWVSASFLLTSCVSAPVAAHLADSFECKDVILSSILVQGLGSLAGDYAQNMALFLAGRGMQGFGAGGLVAIAYTTYCDMEGHRRKMFRGAICAFTAAGTAGGPFVGAVISNSQVWVRYADICVRFTNLAISAGHAV